MEWEDLLIEGYGEAFNAVESALDELSQEDLNWQPRSDCNSIGWTTWHLTRVLDYLISSITEEEQLWTKYRWHAKFNRSPDPSDIGAGHSTEQVAEFKSPDAETHMNYLRVALEMSKRCMANLSSSELSREIDDPWSQYFPTVGSRLSVALSEVLQHAGHVCYMRGHLKGKGWQEF